MSKFNQFHISIKYEKSLIKRVIYQIDDDNVEDFKYFDTAIHSLKKDIMDQVPPSNIVIFLKYKKDFANLMKCLKIKY